MKRHSVPFEPVIAKHCEESWAAMEGSSRERHCQSCDKRVHNFAAMTPREIEKLVFKSSGKLCARITRREDGSLVTLKSQPRASLAAQVAVSASLALSAAGAIAQTTGKQARPETAVLTGTVLQPDGSGPFSGAMVTLARANSEMVLVHVDDHGAFRAAVKPGTYDIRIIGHFSNPLQIPGAVLHEGEQSLQPIRVPEVGDVTTTGGDVAIQWRFSLATVARHPIAYLKYLARKL